MIFPMYRCRVRFILSAYLCLLSTLALGDSDPSAYAQMVEFNASANKPAWITTMDQVNAQCNVSSDSFTVDNWGNSRGTLGFTSTWQVEEDGWHREGWRMRHKGKIEIDDGKLVFEGGCCSGNGNGHRITRGVSTEYAGFIQIWLRHRPFWMGAGDWSLDIYSNGTWHNNFRTYHSNFPGPDNYFDEVIDVPASYASADMQIRFHNYARWSNGDRWRLDHVRVYQCQGGAPAVDHFRLSHASTAITCDGGLLNVGAYDDSGNSLDPSSGDVLTLEARLSDGSATSGKWVKVSGNGSLVDADHNDGQASYTFGSNDANTSFRFYHNGEGIVNFNVVSNSKAENPAYDPLMTFNNVGIKLSGEQMQIVGKPSSVAPNNSPMVVQLVNTNDDNGACESRVPAGSALSFNVSARCLDSSNGVVACAVSGNQLLVSSGANNTDITESDTPVSFNFVDIGGGDVGARFNVNHYQAGNFQLSLNGTLPASGDNPAVAVAGLSQTYTARPFALNFKQIINGATPNPAALPNSALANADFVSAGTNFSVDVEAVKWQSADDTNNDGVADTGANLNDNAILQIEGLNSLSFSTQNQLPNVGSAGVLSLASTAMVDSDTSRSTLAYSEVGSIEITAALNNYMGSGFNLSGVSGTVGRFYPASFSLGSSVVAYNGRTNSAASHNCDFALMGQDASVAITLNNLQALDANGVPVTKYDSTVAQAYATRSPNLAAENANDGVNLESRLSQSVLGGSWQLGKFVNSNIVSGADYYSTLSFGRDVSPDGPYHNVQLSLMLDRLNGLDSNADTSGNCSGANCSSLTLGGAKELSFYYGALFVPAVLGLRDEALPIPLEIHYIDSTQQHFKLDAESCLHDTGANFWQADAGLSGALAGDTSLNSGSPRPDVSFENGVSHDLVLDAPNKLGKVTLSLTPRADWLKHDWNGDGSNTGPVVDIEFSSMHRGHNKVISWQEQ